MANYCLEQAAELDGCIALVQLGDSCYENRDYVNAKKYYKRAAKQGDAYALKLLGDIYINGQGVKKIILKLKITMKKHLEMAI